MIFVIFLVAADLATLGLLGPYASVGLVFGLLSVLPMSNILAVATYRALTRRTSRRPFLIGFGLAGGLAVLIWFHLFLEADDRQLTAMVNWYAKAVVENVRYYTKANDNLHTMICLAISLIVCASMSILPQMLLAFSCGWFAQRFAAKSRARVASLPPSL